MAAEPARSSAPAGPRASSVVQPLSRAAHRRCSRPGCPTPARVTLSFQYDARRAVLAALHPDERPETYDLCGEHADRTRPPHGWTLDDHRPDDDPASTPDADDLASPRTVAVLAAALRGDPAEGPDSTAVDEHDGDVAGVDVRALDAIADEPLEDPADLDLFGSPDDAAATAQPATTWPQDALHELSALAEDPGTSTSEPPDAPPARTVPGARRPD